MPTAEVDLHFVTHARGVDRLNPALFPNVTICGWKDERETREVCAWLLREHSVKRVVTVHEKMMLLAAELRSEFGLPGLDLDVTRLFRDKVRMKQAVLDAGAAQVPAFARLRSADDLRSVDWSTGRKVVKSCFGAGAQDVYVVETLAEAEALLGQLDLLRHPYEVEEYVEGLMYHCDSVVKDRRVSFAAVSEYLSKPGDFTPSGMGGSVLLGDDVPIQRRILELNALVLSALGLQEGVSHLEVFHTPADELVFCEVAARPAGGGIDRIIERSRGINILEASIRLQAGLAIEDDREVRPDPGAWAVIGFYPGGAASPGLAPGDFARFGIAEHVRGDWAGDGAGGVRHCTDYQDEYVLRGADRADLDARIAAIRKEYAARSGG